MLFGPQFRSNTEHLTGAEESLFTRLIAAEAAKPAENRSFYADRATPNRQDLRPKIYGIDRYTLRDKSQPKSQLFVGIPAVAAFQLKTIYPTSSKSVSNHRLFSLCLCCYFSVHEVQPPDVPRPAPCGEEFRSAWERQPILFPIACLFWAAFAPVPFQVSYLGFLCAMVRYPVPHTKWDCHTCQSLMSYLSGEGTAR